MFFDEGQDYNALILVARSKLSLFCIEQVRVNVDATSMA